MMVETCGNTALVSKTLINPAFGNLIDAGGISLNLYIWRCRLINMVFNRDCSFFERQKIRKSRRYWNKLRREVFGNDRAIESKQCFANILYTLLDFHSTDGCCCVH